MMVKRRFFLGLSLLCPFFKLDTLNRNNRKLVIDYTNRDNPDLFRTVALLPKVKLYGNDQELWKLFVVKRAWLWSNNCLEIEYYNINDCLIQESSNSIIYVVNQYTLITYDGYGNVKYKITNIA